MAWGVQGSRANRVFPLWKRVALALPALVSGSVFAQCWEEAGRTHSVDPVLLRAIAWQESRGNPRAVGPLLKDRHRALGLMQINTVHLPTLGRWGISREDLFDPCKSQLIGAWILRQCMDEFGNRWQAVACYYGGPKSRAYARHLAYVRDVQRHYAGYASVNGVALPVLPVASRGAGR